MFQVLRIQPDTLPGGSMGQEVRMAERLRKLHFAAREAKEKERTYFDDIRKGAKRAARVHELRRLEGHLLEGVQRAFRTHILESRQKLLDKLKLEATPS